jgi:hypothetical protein
LEEKDDEAVQVIVDKRKKMKFKCSELQGAGFQPKEILKLDNCWIIPAFKASPVLFPADQKLLFVYQEDSAKGNEAIVEYWFVHFYQFTFCTNTNIYREYSLKLLSRTESFILNGDDINDIEKIIRTKYVLQDKKLLVYLKDLTKDFNKIEGPWGSWLPRTENFQRFYDKFTDLFRTDEEFKGIVTLFCETIDGIKILYDNVLQNIAQLQTIAEIILGRPIQSYCEYCKNTHNEETWYDFLVRKLAQYDISEQEKSLVIKVKMALNDARVEFVHNAKYYNPNETCNLFIDSDKIVQANLSIEKILEKKTDDWISLNWINAYKFYLVAVRNLIYLKYFQA